MGTGTDEVNRIQQQIATTRDDMGRTLHAIEGRIGPTAMKERARDATLGRMETMFDKVKANPLPLAMAAVTLGWFIASVRSSSNGKLSQVKERVTDKTGELKEQAKEQAGRVENLVERTFHDNPLAVGLGVVAAGVAVGLALPITQREQRWLGGARDRLIEKAEHAADEALDKVDEQNVERPVANAVDPTGF